jgi:predicted Zn-dependent protease
MGEATALLAMAFAKQERYPEAAERFQEALDQGADSPALRLGYAAALESLGRIDESRRQWAAYESLKGN